MELDAAYSARAGSSKAATGVTGEPAVTVAPGGGATTESRWLIHTVCSAGRSQEERRLARLQLRLPELETSFDSTEPPSSRAISCIP